MSNFETIVCPNCNSKKFKKISDNLIITCICGTVFNQNKENNKDYITGKEAQLLLDITTRQGLIKIVKEHNITTKPQGAGKPNLYLRDDIIKAKESRRKTSKHKPKKIINKVQKQKEQIQENIDKSLEVKKKVDENKNREDFTPLNGIGTDEFNRVVDELKDKGIYDELDRALILAYAIAYQKYINAVVSSAEYDDISTDGHGNQKVHPHFQIADKCFSHMQKMANMLGIGTRSRIGVDIKQKKEKSIVDILSE